MKKIVIGVIIGLLVLTGGTLIVLEKIGDMMINALIDSELQGLNDSLDDLDNLLTDPTPLPSDFNNTATPEAEPEATPEQSPEPQGTEDSQPQSTPKVADSGGKSTPTATPATSPKPSTSSTPKPSPTATPITVTQIKDVKDEVTSADKVVAASMVMKKLSASDISTLQGMLSGGLSAEEKEKAKDIAYARFTEEEIAKIKELYHKYMK